MTKHTSGPWHYVHNKKMGLFQICDTKWHEKGETSLLASVSYDLTPCGLSQHECEANAAFIVKAVNCHEELLAALKTAMMRRDNFAPSELKEFDSAIAKAEAL